MIFKERMVNHIQLRHFRNLNFDIRLYGTKVSSIGIAKVPANRICYWRLAPIVRIIMLMKKIRLCLIFKIIICSIFDMYKMNNQFAHLIKNPLRVESPDISRWNYEKLISNSSNTHINRYCNIIYLK